MFIFKDRVTKEVVKTVDITTEILDEQYNGDLKEIFPEYDVFKHTAGYEQA